MEKEKIYIIEDEYACEFFAFKNRNAAIQKMFEVCLHYGEVLYILNPASGVKKPFMQYVTLSSLYPTKDERLEYLFNCSIEELNDVFDSYWRIRECEIEDS